MLQRVFCRTRHESVGIAANNVVTASFFLFSRFNCSSNYRFIPLIYEECKQPVIVIENAKKSFGSNEVMKDISFQLNKQEKPSNLGNGTENLVLPNVLYDWLKADSGLISRYLKRYKSRRKKKKS
jgi:hypothetical protein